MDNNTIVINKDIILLKDVDYFGRKIHKGSTFKKCSNIDYYQLYENNNGIIMHCPTVMLHFTLVIDGIEKGYFVEQYSDK